ncbi:hypothetical protein FE257_004964, partial [Aspergillus nanangensis]
MYVALTRSGYPLWVQDERVAESALGLETSVNTPPRTHSSVPFLTLHLMFNHKSNVRETRLRQYEKMNDSDIKKWISTLPASGASINASVPTPDPTGENQLPLPSPPESRKRRQNMASSLNSTPKRQRMARDVDETPRAKSNQGDRAILQSPVPSIPAATESSERSQASGRSSPLKRLRTMELSSDRVKIKVLDATDPHLPAALSKLLNELEDCNDG